MINRIGKRAFAIVFTVSLLGLGACSSAPDQEDIQRVPNKSAQALYEDAKQTTADNSVAITLNMLSA